ncbi:hypothetical protein FUT87_16350 [Mitsuaria sp. TWR114]|uniref:Uncharacterized protein n=1 Tax=Roseateles chitinivorans TaxID=2917965 RepID=A0A2G9C4U4_9BURK|nr:MULTISPECIES: hypothetical protein [Roseateles]PIM51372.1 hypothetical protein CS062_20095 [Roseateles chitinivorans]TXD83808.1 hypothetical protein FUT87_16350 [Mitsuaria sp. TWR114]SFR92136.1 hypothetical protein SAMN05428960_3214 [Mitsuaria sp. PDC51]
MFKRYFAHRGKDIFVTAGSVRDLAPGSFGICAIGGGAEGWSVVHVGPDGDAADLGGEYYFATAEEALAFLRELIDLMIDGGEPEGLRGE